MTKQYDIERFVTAQNGDYDKAKEELLTKKKRTHWMWYMFPILNGLGNSVMSDFYGLDGIDEAKEYWKNDQLKNNLIELTEIVLSYDNKTSLVKVFGYIDAQKFYSCMTLFYLATKETLFKRAISRYFDGILDDYTIQIIKNVI